MEARRQAVLSARSDVADRLAGHQRNGRWVPPRVKVAAAKHGIDPDSPAADLLRRGSAKSKAKKGLGWHSVGDFVEAVGGGIGDTFRAVTRGGMAALSAPYEEMQAGIRHTASQSRLGSAAVGAGPLGLIGAAAGWAVGDEVEGEAKPFQSSAAIAIGQAVRGKEVDMGSGYFVGGEVEAEQRRRASTVKIGGKSLTPGRLLSTSVAEPGTKPYNVLSGLVDAGYALRLDPAIGVGKVAGRAAKARKSFSAATVGLVDGRTKSTVAEVAEDWLLHSDEGRAVIGYAKDSTNIREMWRKFGRKVDIDTVVQLSRATDEQQVIDILLPKLGTSIDAKPIVKRSFSDVRLLQSMPGHHVDLTSADETVTEIERWLINAKMDSDFIDKTVEKVATAGSPIGRYKAVVDALGETSAQLMQTGVGKQRARRMTTMVNDYVEEMRHYFVDEIGNDMPVLGAQVNGFGQALPTPHAYVEYINRALPLPDAREIRRATNSLGRIIDNPAVKTTEDVLDAAIQNIWKPFVLLRGAWTVRVVGEEQVRMSAGGLDSAFKHPLSAIAYVLGRKGNFDVHGNVMDDAEEFVSALSRKGGWWRDKRVVRGKRVVARGHAEYVNGWADELGQAKADPIMKRVAGGWSKGDGVPNGLTGNHVDDAKRWFYDGTGRKFRNEIGEARPELVDDAVARATPVPDNPGRNFRDAREASDWFIDSQSRRIQIKTANDADLLDAIRTGKWDGEDITTSKKFRRALEGKADAGAGPEKVKADLAFSMKDTPGGRVVEQYNKAVDWGFSALMSKPTNYLSRSSSFKQFYWNRAAELITSADAKTQQALISAARKAKLNDVAARMEDAAAKGTGGLALGDIDTIAKGYGLDQTKKLLYDLSQKSQMADSARLIAPFGEAWKEIMTTWARLTVETGGVPIRRAQQIVEGARGAGFFYTDPTTGEEVFNYPFSELVNEKLLDVPFPMVGRVSGLNLIGNSVMPGVGPVAQIPSKYIIPNKPEWKWLREAIMPFGDPSQGEEGIEEAVLPAWFKKFRTWATGDPESDRAFANTVGDVQRYLVSTGEYSTRTPEEQTRLLAAATTKAKWLYFMRGVTQFGGPTGGRPLAFAELTPRGVKAAQDAWRERNPGKELPAAYTNGDLVASQLILDDFSEMQKKDYDGAVLSFLQKYGDNALLFMQPKSRATVGALPVTSEGDDWVSDNPEIVKKYRNTYGYFAPQGDPEDFEFSAYNRQFATGEREMLTPEEQIKLANNRVAQMIYSQARKRAEGMGDAGDALLRQLKAALATEYPGFDEKVGLAERAEFPQLIRELTAASEDDAIAETDAGQGLIVYLAARDRALKAAEQMGVSTLGGKKVAGLRKFLRDMGASLSTEHPGFARLYEELLSREVDIDEEEAA